MARLLALANVLAKSRQGVSLRVLADRQGWNLRALYRDIEALEKAGFPIVHDAQRYRLLDPGRAPVPAAVDADELLGLFLARQLAAGWKHTRAGRGLERLWAKLSVNGSETPALLPASPPWLAVPGLHGIDYTQYRTAIATIERALRERRALACRYTSASAGELTARTVEPGELYWDPRLETLYLIAWCRLRGDVRVFAVHRFRAVVLSDDPIPHRAETASRNALRAAFRVWRGEHVERVRIAFSGPAARLIRERKWHASQKLTDLPDGRTLLELEVAGLEEITRWILGFGSAAETLAPTALVQLIRAELASALGHYPGETVTRFDNAQIETGRMGPRRRDRHPRSTSAAGREKRRNDREAR